VNTFKEMNLPVFLQEALTEMKFSNPTEIQARAYPAILSNRDLIGTAHVGAGKKIAICLPVITRLLRLRQKSALILIPNRSLALKLEKTVNLLTSAGTGPKVAVLAGGKSLNAEAKALVEKPGIIIATPERLLEHLRSGNLSLFSTEILILNETCQILASGQGSQLIEILRFLPKTRQTVLFAVEMTAEVEKVASKLLRDPVRIAAEPVAPVVTGLRKKTVAANSSVLVFNGSPATAPRPAKSSHRFV
jgi:superfamily II DNA/RNA helicase